VFKTIANAWKTVDLRKKILFTVLIVLLYRVGTAIPVPFLNAQVLSSSLLSSQGSLFQYLNILSGGAMSQATLFALGVSPYITASIVIQLLTIAIPYLERISKEGEEGQKKLNQLTRIATVVLGLVTSFGYYKLLENNNAITNKGVFPAFVIILSYCAGSSLVMWLAEKINENGIGNGISIILFANIVSRLPSMIHNLWSAYLTSGNAGKIILGIGVIIVSLAATALIVFITDSERRLPIQYAKKVVGRKMYGGQSSTLPLKVNMTGVMPMIFANSIVSIPATIQMFVNPKQGSFWAGFFNLFGTDGWLYAALTAILIVAFAYFYVTISFNPIEVANNLKKNGGFIPGIRPGKPTSDYITKVLSRITLIGALFLVVIAVVPLVANIISGAKLSSLAFTGSSIIIVVGVVLETAREIESQMTMRHYKGFLE
jgi:preprotein translocase, secY subunit